MFNFLQFKNKEETKAYFEKSVKDFIEQNASFGKLQQVAFAWNKMIGEPIEYQEIMEMLKEKWREAKEEKKLCNISKLLEKQEIYFFYDESRISKPYIFVINSNVYDYNKKNAWTEILMSLNNNKIKYNLFEIKKAFSKNNFNFANLTYEPKKPFGYFKEKNKLFFNALKLPIFEDLKVSLNLKKECPLLYKTLKNAIKISTDDFLQWIANVYKGNRQKTLLEIEDTVSGDILIYFIKKVFGEISYIDSFTISGKFNGLVEGHLILYFGYTYNNFLEKGIKKFILPDVITINKKYMKPYNVKNIASGIFRSDRSKNLEFVDKDDLLKEVPKFVNILKRMEVKENE